MRRTLFLLFIFLTPLVKGTTFYIDPSGSDISNKNGSLSAPWKTLAYACSRVTTSGDIIHINAGTFIETVTSSLAVGVSIVGEGATSIIHSHLSTEYYYTIELKSLAEGTSGNQSISYIKMDGDNTTAWGAIGVWARSNVIIHHCTFVNFNIVGVMFNGGVSYLNSAPTKFAVNNSFYNNVVTNCAYYPKGTDGSYGNLSFGGQENFSMYNDTIVQTARADGYNGFCVKFYSLGHNKGTKIYNNYIEKSPFINFHDNNSWDFSCEFFFENGLEIYNNTIIGNIDIVEAWKGEYAYGAYIHDNLIGRAFLNTDEEVGIDLEYSCKDILISKNIFRNLSNPILITGFAARSGNGDVNNIYIYDNVMYNIGSVSKNYHGRGIRWIVANTSIIDNINIWNNTMYANPGVGGNTINTMYGIEIPGGDHVTNVSIRNNIIQGFNYAPVLGDGSTATGMNRLSVENNIFYETGNSNAVRFTSGFTATNYTNQNNIIDKPDFVNSGGDFHLLANSPAIGKGVSVDVTRDYDDMPWSKPPSIGAYEYNNSSTTLSVPMFQSSVVENLSSSILEIKYNLTLANIIPATSVFAVTVNSTPRTVSSVVISGTKVLLTLASHVAYGDAVTVSYAKPYTNPLQTLSGGQAASFTALSVTNNCTAPLANLPPLVSLSSPTKSTSFISPATITIDAVASDPDGTIAKVEFYNGTVKLGERAVTPYSYVWKDVTDGTYSITAVATDNINSKTVSAAVSVVVEKAAVAVNQLPVVSISSPNKNKNYKKNDKIIIEVMASDPDGIIRKVELKSGNITLIEMTTAPYSYIWEAVDTGTYLITAIATDNLGATSTSSNVELIIDHFYDVNSEIINLYPNPNDGRFSIDLVSSSPAEKNNVTIISLTGKTVYSGVMTDEENTRHFDISNADSGAYILMVSDGNTIATTKKFIKN